MWILLLFLIMDANSWNFHWFCMCTVYSQMVALHCQELSIDCYRSNRNRFLWIALIIHSRAPGCPSWSLYALVNTCFMCLMSLSKSFLNIGLFSYRRRKIGKIEGATRHIVHELVGTGLRYAPPACMVHKGDLCSWEIGVAPDIFHFSVVHKEHAINWTLFVCTWWGTRKYTVNIAG